MDKFTERFAKRCVGDQRPMKKQYVEEFCGKFV